MRDRQAVQRPELAAAAARWSAASASASAASGREADDRVDGRVDRGDRGSRCAATTSRADSSRRRSAAASSRAVHQCSGPGTYGASRSEPIPREPEGGAAGGGRLCRPRRGARCVGGCRRASSIPAVGTKNVVPVIAVEKSSSRS